MADVAGRLLPAARFQIGDDVLHERLAVPGRHDIGAQRQGVGALRAPQVLQFARGRIAVVPPEIGRDPRVQFAITAGVVRAVQNFRRPRDGARQSAQVAVADSWVGVKRDGPGGWPCP